MNRTLDRNEKNDRKKQNIKENKDGNKWKEKSNRNKWKRRQKVSQLPPSFVEHKRKKKFTLEFDEIFCKNN